MKTKLFTLLLILAFYSISNTTYAQTEAVNFNTRGSENIIQPAIVDQSNSFEIKDFSRLQIESNTINVSRPDSKGRNPIPSPGSPGIELILNQTDSVTDIDGNVYQTVQIGDRWWMAKSLRAGRFRNGDPIHDATGLDSLLNIDGMIIHFSHDHNPGNDNTYGKIYSWEVVNDSRGICPEGWYVPTRKDLEDLRDYLHVEFVFPIQDFAGEWVSDATLGGGFQTATATVNPDLINGLNLTGFLDFLVTDYWYEHWVDGDGTLVITLNYPNNTINLPFQWIGQSDYPDHYWVEGVITSGNTHPGTYNLEGPVFTLTWQAYLGGELNPDTGLPYDMWELMQIFINPVTSNFTLINGKPYFFDSVNAITELADRSARIRHKGNQSTGFSLSGRFEEAAISSNNAGGKMKTTGTIEEGTGLWHAPNTGATNESGFSAVASGWHIPYMYTSFMYIGERFMMFTSTETSPAQYSFGVLGFDEEDFGIGNTGSKSIAMSIRCIRNTSASVQPPSVTTLPAADLMPYSAVIKGAITDDGGESVSNRGFYWGKNPNPTNSDNRTYNGSGSGEFDNGLVSLRPSTTYYYKAFAKNNAGVSFGEVMNFSTPAMDADLALSIASGSFLDYWQAIKQYNVGMTADVMADHSTASWGNFAWRDSSEEPRIPWNNSPAYGDAAMTRDLWWSLYNLVSKVNDVLYAVEVENLQIGAGGEDNAKVEATMYLIRGLALGQIGLTFDQAWIAQDNSGFEDFDLEPWQDVLNAAIADLEKAITICSANSFSWGFNVINGQMVNNNYLKTLASSHAARFLALGARNQKQNDDLSWTTNYSWQDILAFANNGLASDFAPIGNGLPWDGGTWWDLNIKYLRQAGWGRIDCRVVNLLDPQYPVRYPTDDAGLPLLPPQVHAGLQPGEANSADVRFAIDFQFLESNSFIPNRGGWHFSHYRHSRYDYPPTTSTEGFYMGESRGPLREFRAYENQLLKAEALARTGNVSGAAAILNDPNLPRKYRGNLPDVAASMNDVLHAIFYERDIELLHNGYLISFCDMRRRDLLQHGTPLHFPVPGAVLASLGLENYTFGGHNNADGVNTSDGGAWIKPFYHFSNNSVTFTVTYNDNPVEAAILKLEESFVFRTTDHTGLIAIELLDGNYSYRISKEGFEDYTDSFSLNGDDLALHIELSPSSVEKIPMTPFRVFPNPFNDFITVEASGVLSAVVIRNVVGKQMASVYAEGQQNIRINTTGFARGIYIVELYSTCHQRVARKMVKY